MMMPKSGCLWNWRRMTVQARGAGRRRSSGAIKAMQAAALSLWARRMDSMSRARPGFNSSTLLGWVHAPGARCGMSGIRLRLWAVASYSWGAGARLPLAGNFCFCINLSRFGLGRGAERETDLRLGHGWGFGGQGGCAWAGSG